MRGNKKSPGLVLAGALVAALGFAAANFSEVAASGEASPSTSAACGRLFCESSVWLRAPAMRKTVSIR
jgi:hypothetical protein